MPYEPPPELAALSLDKIDSLIKERKLPTVEAWNPASTGDSNMRIAKDGRWYHEGRELTRPAMVRAFASLIMADNDGQHWLITPEQKLKIAVDDAAFMAADCQQIDGDVVFRLNTDEIVIAGPKNPISVIGNPATPAIYVSVRRGVKARLNRSTYLQLVEIAMASPDLVITSKGATYSLVTNG